MWLTLKNVLLCAIGQKIKVGCCTYINYSHGDSLFGFLLTTDNISSKRQAEFFCFRQTDYVCQYWKWLCLGISYKFFQPNLEGQ